MIDTGFEYTFEKDKVSITVKSAPECKIVLPPIALKNEFKAVSDTQFVINRNGAMIYKKNDRPMKREKLEFGLVGGFEFVSLNCNGELRVEITAK